MPANFTYQINAPELFGGEDAEGGIVGPVNVLFGGPEQTPTAEMQTLMGGLVPGFRGVVSTFFNGLLCVNNPYPKPWAYRLRRWDEGWDGEPWYPEKAMIRLGNETDGLLGIKAMNAAHIIYECATNRDWGRGLDRAILDESVFAATADTLFDEKFGLCLKWGRKDKLSAFVQSVLNHIGGTLYIDRGTGLMNLKLIRGDYDPDNIPTFGFGSGLLNIESDESAAQGESQVNQIIVKYFDPIKKETRSIRAQNLALHQASGVSNTETSEYKGLPTPELASRVAHRDLKTRSMGLKRFKVTLDRRGYELYPGAIFAIEAPSRGYARLILRAGKVSEGGIQNGAFTVIAAQDVFGLPATVFSSQDSQWVPPSPGAPTLNNRRVMEASYRQLYQRLTPADLAAADPNAGTVFAIAGRPTGSAVGFLVASRVEGEGFVARALGSFSPIGAVAEAISEYDTTLVLSEGSDLDFVRLGMSALIETEIVRVDAVDLLTLTLTIARGCEDTIPAPHAVDAAVWFPDDTATADGREYGNDELVEVKLLPKTSSEVLAVELVPSNSIKMRRRWFRPYPPGAVEINGDPYADVASVASSADVVLTWAHRNRLTQQDILIEHEAASITPEIDTTYTIRVYDDATLLRTVTGITDPGTWTYTNAMWIADGSHADSTFELETVRDGLESLQRYRFTVARP